MWLQECKKKNLNNFSVTIVQITLERNEDPDAEQSWCSSVVNLNKNTRLTVCRGGQRSKPRKSVRKRQTIVKGTNKIPQNRQGPGKSKAKK